MKVYADPDDESLDGEYHPVTNDMILYNAFYPSTVVHEYCHMLTYLFISLYGSEQALKAKWEPLNHGVAYGSDIRRLTDEQRLYFYTDYALTDLYEDIAETAVLLADASEPESETLKKKAALLESMYDDLRGADPARLSIYPREAA